MDNIKVLTRIVQANIGLSKPRQTCLAAMVVGIVQARTVNLKRVCQSCSSDGLTSSWYRRMQRFFAEADFNFEKVAKYLRSFVSLPLFLWEIEEGVNTNGVSYRRRCALDSSAYNPHPKQLCLCGGASINRKKETLVSLTLLLPTHG